MYKENSLSDNGQIEIIVGAPLVHFSRFNKNFLPPSPAPALISVCVCGGGRVTQFFPANPTLKVSVQTGPTLEQEVYNLEKWAENKEAFDA